MKKCNYKSNEIVWETTLKIKVKFGRMYDDGKWFKVQSIEAGDFWDTKNIEKYINQDEQQTTVQNTRKRSKNKKARTCRT
jgi:hypothetical protein